jgi:hypothetical protein
MNKFVFESESTRLHPFSIYGKLITDDGWVRSYDIPGVELDMDHLLFQKIAKSTIVGQIDKYTFRNLCDSTQDISSGNPREKILYKVHIGDQVINIGGITQYKKLSYHSKILLRKLSKLLNKKEYENFFELTACKNNFEYVEEVTSKKEESSSCIII